MNEYTKTTLDFFNGGNVLNSRSTLGYCRWICASHKNAAQMRMLQKICNVENEPFSTGLTVGENLLGIYEVCMYGINALPATFSAL